MQIPRSIALSLTVLLALSACGSDDDATPADSPSQRSEAPDEGAATSQASGADGGFPVTIESEAGSFTLDEAPENIVSLSPSSTEILFAIGAGDQVVAADAFSTYPDDAPTTELSGFDPNVEAITEYDPDLVVISNDANDLVASLTELDIPVLVNPAPADIEAGYAGMAELGVATGHPDETATAITDLRAQVDEALATAPEPGAEPIRVYHELDDTYFTVSQYGFVGSVYAQMGAVNIGDEADADQTGFPQMTEEAVIAADPQVIVITDQVDYTAQDVASRPGWEDVTAVREGNIVTVDADIASRWGPRLPEFVRTAADALSAATVSAN
ncbi:MAG: helical backbone metal receptor [Ornithinimicrobium sp.]